MASTQTTSSIVVLKFGSSVLRSASDLPDAVQCIYRHVRSGRRVVAVVSAFAGETDRLFAEAQTHGLDREATAEFVAEGERAAAAALVEALRQCGLAATGCDPDVVSLHAVGPVLDAMLDSLDVVATRSIIDEYAVTVLPGFFAIDTHGRTVLLGRGGSDLTAIWIADQLGADCTLVKDVDGLYQRDPALPGPPPARLVQASWRTAVAVGGRLLQRKAVEYAHVRHLKFSITSPWSDSATLIGPGPDQAAPPVARPDRRLRVALLGCGTVGGGVLERLRSLESRFEVTGVLVRDMAKHAHELCNGPDFATNGEALLAERPDVVIELLGGQEPARTLIDRAL
ncbi:MAG TPA: hypothetical protein VLT59_06565, partial [Steroidobacteraceae bacterium]|nr:hypothetical protein [Steroidobacteraceae bacterium]